ncbi:MAG: SDR family NAD(P)-dependent oxidoreductase [Acidimicrobiia bacterium]|nr:SDR family NAD(P)-dependent oxidoreductase [Acidimicrobiia bacterium]
MYVVTGASMGIGRAVASELARRGLDVVAVARSPVGIEGAVEVSADLATADGVAAVAQVAAGAGPIDGIVHGAASLIKVAPYGELDPQSLTDHFAVHVGAPIALYRSLVEHNGVRRMLYIDSFSSTTHRAGWSGYSIIKAAAQMAARAAAVEAEATEVIRVFPGAVDTRIVDEVLTSDSPSAPVYAAMRDKGELADPADTARFVAALLVDASDELLATRETWDYNDPEDRAAAS